MKRGYILVAVLAAILIQGVVAQFPYRQMSPLASESFRIAVEAYNRGRYAEALAQFERSLADNPSDPLCLYWLGKSYFRLGLNGAAFDRWNDAVAVAGGSPLVESRLELAGATGDPFGIAGPTRYVRVAELEGGKQIPPLFLRPTWIEPLSDGSSLVVSHGTNALAVFDVNGRQIRTMTAGVSGLDRPFAAAALPDGTFVVSEFQSDRIARLDANGLVTGYLGGKEGSSRLSGPQYLAVDGDGFVFATDVGFSRVVKFSPDGQLVASFGGPVSGFGGLRMPTGIAVARNSVFVADLVTREIYRFDPYGNFLETVRTVPLMRPEGMRALEDGTLLVADHSRVLRVDPSTGKADELYRSERKTPRILSAAIDANGELLVADFDASEVAYLSDPESRFAGLAVDIVRINADRFPMVSVDVSVRTRTGLPVTGLGISNFYASETIVTTERRVEGDIPVDYLATTILPATDFMFEGSLDVSDSVDMVYLVEASGETSGKKVDIRDVITAIQSSAATSAASLVVAGSVPQPAVRGGLDVLAKTITSATYSAGWRFDAGLRLAAGSLFPASSRRAVVYVGTGSVNEPLLQGASLSELLSLLDNNGISLYAVILGGESPSDALRYLTDGSGGIIVSATQQDGLGIISRHLKQRRTGMYRLSYTSTAYDNFGKAYLPVNLEVYLRDRSGKDEAGFFAPLR